jgi:hypothetical protein
MKADTSDRGAIRQGIGHPAKVILKQDSTELKRWTVVIGNQGFIPCHLIAW